MKHCPFCAEEIQDAAIVCKHCGRDLTARTVTLGRRRWRRYVFGIVALASLPIAMLYCGEDRQN